ncbi:MAG: nucleotide exchange factor GrpE [Bacteroidales bacterium]|nr:nucleotide exchange factor GrpE [Bacteroidales bacterium]
MFKLKKTKKKMAEQENKKTEEQNKDIETGQEVNGEQKAEETSEEQAKEQKEDTAESLGNKLLEINDKYLRLYSEFENYRKRTNKERIDLIENASEQMIKDILPVIDDFERALSAMEKESDEKVKKSNEGLELIYKKLYSVLEKKGLKPIEAKGQIFDENLHEAVSQLPAQKEEDKGKVFDEVQKGYYLNSKVIRYSKVVVSV